MKKIPVLACVMLISGCATIVKDNVYPVTISSVPDADFVVKNLKGYPVISGHTPQTVPLVASAEYFKGEEYSVLFMKEGYRSSVSTINSKLSGWYWGNFIFGGLIGFLMVDPASGDMWTLPPSVSGFLTK